MTSAPDKTTEKAAPKLPAGIQSSPPVPEIPCTPRTPLVDTDAICTAYGTACHAEFVKVPHGRDFCLKDYEPMKLSSFRVCFSTRGTILEEPVLWIEQLILFLIFAAAALPVYIYFKEEAVGSEDSVRRFVREQEGKMRAFAMIMTGLCVFLLSFYTSIIVGRWWTMRSGGIGAIKAATVDLELLLYQSVTQDQRILEAVRKYGRTSMLLIFMWRRKQLDEPTMRQLLCNKHELLTDEEATALLAWKHCLHETIWAWQAAIVNNLHKQGKIKSDQLYGILLQKCLDGRSAAQLIHTHLAVRVPMQYVHVLGLLVKMHNFVLSAIMGVLFGAAWSNGLYIICLQLWGRLCILPFLFNAILLINCELADPFDGSETDFPGEVYQMNLDLDCKKMIEATDRVPKWLQEGQP